jgi:hypothetical protein
MNNENQYPKKIVSGGQTGADQAALGVAIKLGIPHGGWVPKGRITEAGFLPAKYKLQEMPTSSYALRTEQNVIDSDGTLIISHGKLTGDSALAEKYADKHERPCLHVDHNRMSHIEVALKIATWVSKNKIGVLTVAGPRASKDPKIYQAVSDVLESAIHLCSVKNIPSEYQKPDTDSDNDIVSEILGEIPLQEKSSIANMDGDQVEILQSVFDMYIRSKIGPDESEDDFNDIMIELWERLKETHRLRSVK